jgi:hypothetical protein
MRSTIRVLVSSIAGWATFGFVFRVPFSLILPGDRLWWVRIVGSLGCAVAVTRYVWRRSASLSQELAGSVAVGAFVVGGIGFTAGFIGPMIFAPGANQGPLLGFFTGPLGVLLGAVGGGIYSLKRRNRAAKSTDDGTLNSRGDR